MPQSHYSKEVQLEILDEIAKNEGATDTIDRDDPVRDWNYTFLHQQGCFKQVLSECTAAPILCGEELTDVGRAHRFTLYEQLKHELERRGATKTQNGLWWMTFVILALTAILAIPSLRMGLSWFGKFLTGWQCGIFAQ